MHAHKPSKPKHKAAPPPPTPARLLLRVHSAKGLHHGVFSQGVYCKMYVGETAMLSGSQQSLFSKMTGGDAASAEHDHDGKGAHQVFRTRTVPQPADAESVALWDENFDVHIPDAMRDILSIRVKSKHRLYPSVLGACAIPLKQLKIGRSVDKWVALLKGSREVASLRLQIVLSPLVDAHKSTERSKADLQADIKTALAANQSADEAIERLITSGKFSNRGGTVILPDTEDDNHQDGANNNQHEAATTTTNNNSKHRVTSTNKHESTNNNDEDQCQQKEVISASTEHVPVRSAGFLA